MGQIVSEYPKPQRCNLRAIQSGGSKATTVLNNGEYMLVSSDNTIDQGGNGIFDSYVVGDGQTQCQNLPVHNILDKTYDTSVFSGLGKKLLPKNLQTVGGVTKNILTSSMLTNTNTIYVIQYDYDLNGATLNVPSGCTLHFDGGSVSNGTLNGSYTIIEGGNYQLFYNITFSGTFNDVLNAMWMGAKIGDSTYDNAPILDTWLKTNCDFFRVLSWPTGTYWFLTPSAMVADKRNKEIRGNNSLFNVNIPDADGEGQYFLSLNSAGEYFCMSDVRIINKRMTGSYNISKTCGVKLNQTQMFNFTGVSIWYFDKAIHLIDVWYGNFTGMNSLRYNRISVFGTVEISQEINTVNFDNLECKGVSSAVAKACWPQEQDESNEDYEMRVANCAIDFHCIANNCKFSGMTIEGFDYGIRFNYMPRSSSATLYSLINISDCYFEGNRTYDIYIGKGYIINPNNLANYFVMAATVLIHACLFHTLKKVFLMNSRAVVTACSERFEITMSNADRKCSLIHDGSLNGTNGSYNVKSISASENVINKSGTSTSQYNTLRDYLISQCGEYLTIRRLSTLDKITDNFQSQYIRQSSIINERSVGIMPSMRIQDIVHPYNIRRINGNTFIEVTSGSTIRRASVDTTYAMRTAMANNTSGNNITLFEFLRRWKAGTAYTGMVNGVFDVEVTADPSTGLIKNANETIVGCGAKSFLDGTNPTADGYYFFVEGLCWIRRNMSYTKFATDVIQCGRTYSEILPGTTDSAGHRKRQFYVSTTTRDSQTAPRVNAIVYNSTTSQVEIYTGFEWVAMTSPDERYSYSDYGSSLSGRASMADFPGQTYFNAATGISYTFWMNTGKTTWGWRTSIGQVDSLEHPNGYDATSNPLDYATELSAGECVNYQGGLYKWNGTGFVKVSTDIQIVHTDSASYDALTTKDNNTLYAIDE